MKPLKLSLFQLTTNQPIHKTNKQLFINITQPLTSPTNKKKLLNTITQHNPLIKNTLTTIIKQNNFITSLPNNKKKQNSNKNNQNISSTNIPTQITYNPTIISNLIKHNQTSIKKLKHTIQTKSKPNIFNFILKNLQQLKKILFDPQNLNIITTTITTSS